MEPVRDPRAYSRAHSQEVRALLRTIYAPPATPLRHEAAVDRHWRALPLPAKIAVVLNVLYAVGIGILCIARLLTGPGRPMEALYIAGFALPALFSVMALWPARHLALAGVLAVMVNLPWLLIAGALSAGGALFFADDAPLTVRLGTAALFGAWALVPASSLLALAVGWLRGRDA